MRETSGTLYPPNSPGIPSATFSLESAHGHMSCDEPGGSTMPRCGPAPARASLSARQAAELGLMTSGTYGPPSSTSSHSAALQSSLENKLRQRTASLGSTLFKLTWKERVTPAGRSISALRASVLRTSGKGCTSWPTPVSNDDNKSVEAHLAMKARMGGNRKAITSLQVASKLASWPTPRANDVTGAKIPPGREGGIALKTAASLASWPTPQAFDAANGGQPRALRYKGNAPSEQGNTRNPDTLGSYRGDLKDYAGLVSPRATPTTRDHKDGGFQPNVPENSLLGRQVWQASGETPTGSGAETKSTGQLNPAHSRWLMGLPPEWDDCAVMAMQSLRPSRKSS